MKYLLLLLTMSLTAQNWVVIDHDVTRLNDVPSNWSIGNGCDIENYIDVFILGDLELKGDCFINNAKLTVHGYIIYNGYDIILECDNSELIEAGPLDISDFKERLVHVWPNPTDGLLYTQKEYSIRVFDMTGKLLGTTLDLTKYSKGMYLIELNKTNIIKIIKN